MIGDFLIFIQCKRQTTTVPVNGPLSGTTCRPR